MKRDTRRMQWRRWKVTKWETTEKKSSNRKATHYICASESHIELPRYTYSSYGTEALYNESREKIHAHNGSSSRSSTHTLSLASHNGRRHFILFSLFFTRFAHLTISTNSIRAIGLRYIAFFATNWYACYCTFHTVGTDGKRARRRRRRRRQVWRRGILYTNIREREQMRCFRFEFFFVGHLELYHTLIWAIDLECFPRNQCILSVLFTCGRKCIFLNSVSSLPWPTIVRRKIRKK